MKASDSASGRAPAHGQVVDGAVHRQRPMSPPGKKSGVTT